MPLAEIIGFNLATPLFAILSLFGVSSMLYLNLSQSIFLSDGAVKLTSTLRLCRVFINILIVCLVCYVFSGDLIHLILGCIINDVLFALISLYLLINKAVGSGIKNLRNCFGDMIKFGTKTSFTPVMQLSQDNAPNIFIGRLMGPEAVAYFALAMSIFKGFNFFPKAITSLLIGISLDKRTNQPLIKIARISSIMSYVAVVLFLPISVLATILIPPIYGTDFNNTLVPLYILLASLIFIPSSSVLQTSFYVVNRPFLPSFMSIISSILLLVMVPLGVMYFGLVGAAGVIFFSRLIVYFLIVYLYIKISHISIFECFRLDLKN